MSQEKANGRIVAVGDTRNGDFRARSLPGRIGRFRDSAAIPDLRNRHFCGGGWTGNVDVFGCAR